MNLIHGALSVIREPGHERPTVNTYRMPSDILRCGQYFLQWCTHVELRPERLFVACSATGRVYRNLAARVSACVTTPFTTREDVYQWIHHEDLPLADEMASVAVKRGYSSGRCRIRLHGVFTLLEYRLLARVCPECVHGCTIIIGHTRPL